jgi:hypothetical protein
MQVSSHQAMKYKRGSFDFAANSNLVIDMLLNNMKIEGQEVYKAPKTTTGNIDRRVSAEILGITEKYRKGNY